VKNQCEESIARVVIWVTDWNDKKTPSAIKLPTSRTS
jgi:hypothetical protein